jgi:hypothetical protein
MRQILAGEIREVMCFEPGERPVFCLTFSNGDKLVAKGEIRTGSRHADRSIPLAGMMMKQVSPSMQVEMLGDRELAALETLAQNPQRFRPPDPAASQRYLKDLMGPDGKALFAWYKMPFFGRLHNAESKAKKNPGLMLLKLKTPPFLLILGKIVAVDQFIGNYDRFTPMGKLQNPGNLLFHEGDGTPTPLGLDFFEAQGEAANLLEPPPDHTRDKDGRVEYKWGGENLLHETNMRFFADRAVASMNDFFRESSTRGIGLLGALEALQFADGMREGVRDLKQFLASRPGLPEGVTARMSKLNWPYMPAPARPEKPAPLASPNRPRPFKTANPIAGRGGMSVIGANR